MQVLHDRKLQYLVVVCLLAFASILQQQSDMIRWHKGMEENDKALLTEQHIACSLEHRLRCRAGNLQDAMRWMCTVAMIEPVNLPPTCLHMQQWIMLPTPLNKHMFSTMHT